MADPDHARGAPPARPHQRLTADGRRMREVLSYSRRGSRFTPSQAAAWEAHAGEWVIPDEAVDDPGFALAGWFGREAPLIVEIGPGVGEATGGARRGPPRPRRARARGVAPRGGQRPRRGRGGRRDQRPVLLGGRGVDAAARRRAGLAGASCGRSSPTRGRRPGTTSGVWSTPASRRSPRPGCGRAGGGGSPPTGPTTPPRCARCWTASRGSPADRWSGGPSGR